MSFLSALNPNPWHITNNGTLDTLNEFSKPETFHNVTGRKSNATSGVKEAKINRLHHAPLQTLHYF
jgi:hypothetical protein